MSRQGATTADYAEGMTLDVVGTAIGVSKETARQIQESGLRKLRMRVKEYGLEPGDAASLSREQPDVYIPRAICTDCGKATGDASEARCPSCRRYEAARGHGHTEGTYSARVFMAGALNILRRWPGTTT